MLQRPERNFCFVESKTVLLVHSKFSVRKNTQHDEKRDSYIGLLRDFDSVKNVPNMEENNKQRRGLIMNPFQVMYVPKFIQSKKDYSHFTSVLHDLSVLLFFVFVSLQ